MNILQIKTYLTREWNDYKRFPDTPEALAYGDAMYLYSKHCTDISKLISALETNRDRVKTSKTWDREFRKETVNHYNTIIQTIKGD